MEEEGHFDDRSDAVDADDSLGSNLKCNPMYYTLLAKQDDSKKGINSIEVLRIFKNVIQIC